ncbi:MAG: helix-turn-helix domain-containing protein [Nanoarchaeota archaeon]|nr:helix-turn-helix domain-containing protein [Nanoarchaeota archaeon]
MAKSNFLLVDLNEAKTKQLAETITSATSRKILNHLAEKEDTETNIAQSLNLPISTVHYHLQKLQQAKLVLAEEFHYSKKGREINHYKLANKYIIIAPKNISGLKEKLQGILPVALAALGISAVIKIITTNQIFPKALSMAVEEAAPAGADALRMAADTVMTPSSPDIALWFLAGSAATIVMYLIITILREKMSK